MTRPLLRFTSALQCVIVMRQEFENEIDISYSTYLPHQLYYSLPNTTQLSMLV
jgi:hypothetical protein